MSCFEVFNNFKGNDVKEIDCNYSENKKFQKSFSITFLNVL